MKIDSTLDPETTPAGEVGSGGCAPIHGSRVDSRPEMSFHDLPADDDEVTRHDGVGCVIPSGAMLEVWRILENDGLIVKIRKPLDDGKQSLLSFGLSRDAAIALHGLLCDRLLYPENVESIRAAQDS